jgi:scavenger receptor class B, member 1
MLFNIWKKIPVEVFLNVYLFNITNSQEFLSGQDKKLKMSEIGPYLYQEILEHKNPTINENGTITFQIVRTIVPVEKPGAADPFTDIVYTPNFLFLGASTYAAKLSKMAGYGFNVLAQGLDAKPILNMTVEKLLWGYEDRMINVASQFLPSLLPTNKFGLLDRVRISKLEKDIEGYSAQVDT